MSAADALAALARLKIDPATVPGFVGAHLERDAVVVTARMGYPADREPSEADACEALRRHKAYRTHHRQGGLWTLTFNLPSPEALAGEDPFARERRAAAEVTRQREADAVAADLAHLDRIFGDVTAEIARADATHGPQDSMPLGGTADLRDAYASGETADAVRGACDRAHADGSCTWVHVEAEELAEAADANTAAEQRTEWVQVAAVAVKAIRALDRQKLREASQSEAPAL